MYENFTLLVLLFSSLFSANLLTYNVYERSDRIDVMLSFDSPHEGSISQKNKTPGTSITLTISDLHYDKMVEKSINSPIIQDLLIIPESLLFKVSLKSDKKISVVTSKTVDGFGLRIRGSIMQASTAPTPIATPATVDNTVPNAMDFIDTRYIIVICVLLVLVFVMLWIRKRLQTMPRKNNSGGGKSWLFNPKTGLPQEVNLFA